MVLRNLQTVGNEPIPIRIENGKIAAVGSVPAAHDDINIEFNNALVFPGLINSHDHLDFNLFPQTGNRLYESYVEWGLDIHQNNKETIDEVLKIPYPIRVKWGLYKNLLAGVTTVVNHGEHIDTQDDLLTIFQDTDALHSVKFEKRWRIKLNRSFKRRVPVSIHVGEGTNAESTEEIDQLCRWNLWRRDIVGIHGIAMKESQAAAFKALVWCPDSNYFLIGKTAAVDQLKKKTTILFGTDSTLSAGWNIWDHLRLARSEQKVDDQQLYEMTGSTAAATWNLLNKGGLTTGCDADIVVARTNGRSGYNAYFATDPGDILLVMHRGKIRLFDEELLPQLQNCLNLKEQFSSIRIQNARKYVYGNLPELIDKIREYHKGVTLPVHQS